MRNEGRKYLYSKQEHPRHLRDPNDEAKKREDIILSEHMFINKHHTNIQGDACYGDAGTILSATYFEKERFRDDLFFNEDVCAASAAKTLKYFIVFGLQSRYFEI